MGKNLKKVIFSVLLLAAVIIVSPKDAKAAGKVWMAGFNDNSITIQWTPQSLNGYRVDGYYLEEIGTQRSIWQGSANTTQVTVRQQKDIQDISDWDTDLQVLPQEKHITGQLTVFMLTHACRCSEE